ncbi:hypothetical protein GGD81_000152 [Rhodobium orientis]|uniref:Uncharacterized protein n=1 Tax=Rhodobium orientis TaxID=34017 RepID=A0A327JUC7_9HYPH|nr:hypothetical protein [Rhodobium orientis]MBB4301137.1 hypothetical protein [Rhodobium orientis]MBK5949801.1 hypothetical protein [Rhodobium orientis]RAI30089.1 hypothetical protein CH339_00730 [Rhodobium orientis]
MRSAAAAMVAFLFCLAGSGAAAAPRANTTAMTCTEAQTLVAGSGAVVLATSTFLYYRFVSSEAQCPREQVTRPAFVPTADDPECPIGYRCASAFNPGQ